MSEYYAVVRSEFELKHYGVIGMRWGVRRKPKEAFQKALKKKQKLEMRVLDFEKAENKAHKNMISALNKEERAINRDIKITDKESKEYIKANSAASTAYIKAGKARNKYQSAKFKASKSKAKCDKWDKRMNKVFGNSANYVI